MSHILTVMVDQTEGRGMAVQWALSEGLSSQLALSAVQAVEHELTRRIVREEIAAEEARQDEAESD